MGKRFKKLIMNKDVDQLSLDDVCPHCGGQREYDKRWEVSTKKMKHILVTTLFRCKQCGKTSRTNFSKEKPDGKQEA